MRQDKMVFAVSMMAALMAGLPVMAEAKSALCQGNGKAAELAKVSLLPEAERCAKLTTLYAKGGNPCFKEDYQRACGTDQQPQRGGASSGDALQALFDSGGAQTPKHHTAQVAGLDGLMQQQKADEEEARRRAAEARRQAEIRRQQEEARQAELARQREIAALEEQRRQAEENRRNRRHSQRQALAVMGLFSASQGQLNSGTAMLDEAVNGDDDTEINFKGIEQAQQQDARIRQQQLAEERRRQEEAARREEERRRQAMDAEYRRYQQTMQSNGGSTTGMQTNNNQWQQEQRQREAEQQRLREEQAQQEQQRALQEQQRQKQLQQRAYSPYGRVSHCVDIEGAYVVNRCGFQIEAAWCKDGTSNCGRWNLSPGGRVQHNIKGYITADACYGPDSVKSFHGRNITCDDRDPSGEYLR